MASSVIPSVMLIVVSGILQFEFNAPLKAYIFCWISSYLSSLCSSFLEILNLLFLSLVLPNRSLVLLGSYSPSSTLGFSAVHARSSAFTFAFLSGDSTMTLTLRLARIKRTRETKNQYAVAMSTLK